MEREFLGSVRVGPDWLAANPGVPHLEVEMGQDFQIRLTLISPQGHREPLELSPHKQAR